MLSKWTFAVLVVAQTAKYYVNGEIECHYCGMKDVCNLPYVINGAEKVNCKNSCMKFDGKDVNGKRVIVRSCGEGRITECRSNEKWSTAEGTLCHCNTHDCNFATTSFIFGYVNIWVVSLGLTLNSLFSRIMFV